MPRLPAITLGFVLLLATDFSAAAADEGLVGVIFDDYDLQRKLDEDERRVLRGAAPGVFALAGVDDRQLSNVPREREGFVAIPVQHMPAGRSPVSGQWIFPACSGFLITPTIALTAGHCISTRGYKVKVGDLLAIEAESPPASRTSSGLQVARGRIWF